MLNKLHLREIFVNGHKSLAKEIDGQKGNILQKILIFDFLPVVISFFLFFYTNFQSMLPQFSSDILSGLSLFSGLLFSLIVVIVDKAKTRKANLLASSNEEEKNYLSKYLIYSEQLVTQISLSILYAFIVIFLLIFIRISLTNFNITHEFSTVLSTIGIILITYFSIQFLILILIIISGMFSIFINEIH